MTLRARRASKMYTTEKILVLSTTTGAKHR